MNLWQSEEVAFHAWCETYFHRFHGRTVELHWNPSKTLSRNTSDVLVCNFPKCSLNSYYISFLLGTFPKGVISIFFGLPPKKPSNEGTFGSHRCFALWTAKMEIIRWLPWRIAWPWWLGDWFHVILPAPGCQGKTLRILLNWQSCNATIWQRFGRSRLLYSFISVLKTNRMLVEIISMSPHSCLTCS